MSKEKTPTSTSRSLRKRLGLYLTILGAFLFLLGVKPALFGMDLSPVVGFVQISVFTFGLGLISLGGYLSLVSLWNGNRKTISAEIGARLVGTGYVISLASGMADVFGLGTRPLPYVPFFGFWQARGVFIGEIVILLGFLLLIPYWQDLLAKLRH